MADSPHDRYWNLLLFCDHPLLQLSPSSRRKVLCFVTCELSKDGRRKNPMKIERAIIALHFDGDPARKGAYIAKLLAKRKGQGLSKRERGIGDAILMALRADPIAHVAQFNRRLAAAKPQ